MHIQTSDQDELDLGFGNYTCNWGVHICGLYETPEERDAIILGFLHQGDEDGDLQLYCPFERSQAEFKQIYATKFPCCCDHTADNNRFQLSSVRDLYYPKGLFSPLDMDINLQAFYEQSQAQGRRNIRATAEMSWALEAIPGVEHLMVYESRLNYFIPNKPWISICMYDVSRFNGQQVMNVLQTHPYAINSGVITRNPYYIDPDTYLAEHAPEFLCCS